MSARRLGRLLGSVVALTALAAGAVIADEPLLFTPLTFEWTADIFGGSVDGLTVPGQLDEIAGTVDGASV
ncbi:hypothetical protein O7627_03635 [Solwaraspora sp. WMMD1047]|uniref:hypothetical protein n=1 Tax=Solwaraspora sp. WMMD1047 TaxID=3016102 RepID=UPI0024176101|nr:hypothetical protein [Solwaraspora sp. WMMD1047]MDG4828395.1 hypothetical protein [Solwaraspora sp. WMMD1047]